jgi:small-conductance mechanosensitive channel
MDSIRNFVAGLDLGPWPTAGLIVAGFLLLAKAAELVFSRTLTRITRRTKTDVDDETIAILHRPLFLSVFFIGLAVATHQVPFPQIAHDAILSILKTLAVLTWLGVLFRLTNVYFSAHRASEGSRFLDPRTVPLYNNMIKIAGVAGGIYLVIVAWHVDATAWLASAGIVGIAVGFAAKDTIANLFAGVFILADAPYKIGDFINLDTGERGEVSHIGLRSTRILTRDDIEITVPNSVIGAAKIVNETGGRWPRERIRIQVGVAYGSDVDLVERILLEVGKQSELVCDDPEPLVRLRNFGESGLDIELLCWIREPVLRGRTLHEMNRAIYKRFAEEGVEIPYPKRDVYIRAMPRPLE